jgi:hypothetical protein
MTLLQFHDIPRLAGDSGGALGEILAIVASAVVAGLIFWILRLDKQRDELIKYQQENDKATLTALNAVTSLLETVKIYLPEMKGDIKEEITSKGQLLKNSIDSVSRQIEDTKSDLRDHISRRNG